MKSLNEKYFKIKISEEAIKNGKIVKADTMMNDEGIDDLLMG